jgi:hypothetical protein
MHWGLRYEDKVTKDGTTARMVLLFLRELVDQLCLGEQQVQQSYACPITRCRRTFLAPLQVVQHLLSCPELSSGEFDCDKCCTTHRFPTNEKDWAQWSGWKCPPSAHPNHDIQRKRSLGSKMRDFALRKKDPSRKQASVASESLFKNTTATDTRPSTATSDAPGSIFAGRTLQHALHFQPQSNQQGPSPGLLDFQKPVLSPGLAEVDGSMLWQNYDGTGSDLPSTVSSIAHASIDDSPSDRLSQNTSQTTLFGTGMGPYQTPTTTTGPSHGSLPASQYMYGLQGPVTGSMANLSTGTVTGSAMCLDDTVTLRQSPVSPTNIRSSTNGTAWWAGKVDAETPRPTPPSTGPETCFPVQAGMMGNLANVVSNGIPSPTSPTAAASPFYPVQQTPTQAMTRALSQESMQSSMTTVFGTPATEVPPTSGLGALSPPSGSNNPSNTTSASTKQATDPVEELVCDECQWKPRGVRENLKGYLRKHKNTHKGVRLACDVPNCVKTFSRLDNLKKHKKDKHGIDESGNAKRAASEYADKAHDGSGAAKRPTPLVMTEADLRGTEEYSMLWPALHF